MKCPMAFLGSNCLLAGDGFSGSLSVSHKLIYLNIKCLVGGTVGEAVEHLAPLRLGSLCQDQGPCEEVLRGHAWICDNKAWVEADSQRYWKC